MSDKAKRGTTFAHLLTAEDVHGLVKALGKSPTGLRNATIVTVLWRSGLRVQEALDLLLRDVDIDGGEFHVRHGKGDVARTVPADRQTIERVRHWLDVRKPIVGARTQAVFCTRNATKLEQTYVRRAMRAAADQAKIAKPVHPHALRHLFAGELQREGTPIAVISRLLGHKSARTTAEYLERCYPDEIRAAIHSRPNWI
jgi:site-specific recombinase XerD